MHEQIHLSFEDKIHLPFYSNKNTVFFEPPINYLETLIILLRIHI